MSRFSARAVKALRKPVSVLPVSIRWALSVARRTDGDLGLAVGAMRLHALSRRSFDGWATGQASRWWEYPWALQQVERRLPGRSRTAADLGAGTSPVPIALTRLGLSTTVVDPDAISLLGRRYNNEWDFADYEAWGVRTIKAGMEEAVLEPASLGFCLSISVIEHLPAETRRQGIAQISRSLEPEGFAIVTIDLLPGTRLLWNRVVDEIESPSVHGTEDDLVVEFAEQDLRLVERSNAPSQPRTWR